MMRLKTALILLLLVTVAMPLMPVEMAAAQGNNPNQCQQFVRSVINELGRSCARLNAGNVCYGTDEAEALPISGIHPGDEFPDGAFDAPGDRVPVTEVARVTTSDLDFDDSWGFAVVKIDAYVGMNEETGEPETAELLYVLPGGVEIEAVNEPVYDADGNLILDDLHLAPMQEIYLRNSDVPPACAEAIPPILFVQSEPGTVIDIFVNEEPIRVEGSGIIEILDNDFMRVTTITGLITLNAESAAPERIPPGFYADICLLVPGDLGLDGQENDRPVGDCDWSDPLPISQAEINRLLSLNLIPTNVLFYNIVIPGVVTPSGVGQPSNRFFFVNPSALTEARDACAEGLISAEICDYLNLNFVASVCPQIVQPALTGLGNCFNTETGLACYGNINVSGLPIAPATTFTTPFSAPGDTVSAEELARLTASNFDLDAQTWGLSLIKVDAFVGMDASGQPQTAELLYTLPGGVELEAAFEPAYDDDGNLILNDTTLAPLQQAYLRLLRQDPRCPGVLLPGLVVRSEPGTPIDFVMNEALIRLEGTVLLDLIAAGETGQMLRLTTLDGQATLNPTSDEPLVATPGLETMICLDSAQDLGLDGAENDRPMGVCEWLPLQPANRAGLDRLSALSTLPQP